jgi:hypothetical protein
MPSSKVARLSREDITSAANTFRSNRQLPKWSVIVEGRELPARPLVLEAAGVPPNDPTNSHQAVALLKERGFEVRYKGKTIQEQEQEEDWKEATPLSIAELIRSLRGRYEGSHSLVDDREREHRTEKDRFAR